MSGPTVIVLAAGQGKRMRSTLPKVLHPLCGRPMLGWVLDQAFALEPAQVLLVTGVGEELVRGFLADAGLESRVTCVRQEEQLGTGHAVRCCLPHLTPSEAPVVVLYGDMPALRGETLRDLTDRWNGQGAERGIALLTVIPDHPRGFGRIVRGASGGVERIVEERDATEEQRAIVEVNVGVYAFRAQDLLEALPKLSGENAQGELYLTDVIGHVLADRRPVEAVVMEDAREALGVNSLSHLSDARAVLQERILEEHLAAGVLIEDPATTYIDHGVEIGTGTHILPCTVIRAGVRIAEHCEVGPFTHLRVGTVLEEGAEVGNFTEAKKSTIGKGTKAKHLTYLGDVTIGARTNIGAGTIVANYDGVHKHPTIIGDDAFVGSGTVIVAPSTVGDGALTGAGAIVTRKNIPPGETWVGVPARRHGASREAGPASEDGDPQSER